MILDLKQLTDTPIRSIITGNEDWLKLTYGFFCPSSSVLTGWLEAHPLVGEQVKVVGQLSYTPVVNCSRCWDEISWPLNVSFTVHYRPKRGSKSPRTNLLSKRDLDTYYYKNDQIDLAELVNEQIQLALPEKTIPATADGSSCQYCQVDLSKTKVYGEERSESVFAVLAKMKT